AGNAIGLQQTTTGGTYTFNNLPVGQTYKERVVTPSGGSDNETPPTSSTTNHASCTGSYASVGYSYTSFSGNQTANFGFVPLKSITVNAFIDIIWNGTNDTGDNTLSLHDALPIFAGNAIGLQQTTTGGTYTFNNLPVGQ